MKRFKAAVAVTLAFVLLGALLAPTAALAGKKKKAPKGPLVVGTDPADDWGANTDPTLQPLGAQLGQELVEATLGLSDDKKHLNFVIKVSSLPPWGGWPEITRYTWNFVLDGNELELDGKWLNYSRGVCDPTAGCLTGTGQPKDPGLQPFFVRGNCYDVPTPATTFNACEELSKVQGVFDPAAGTITIPVPLADIKAKPGSKVAPGPNTFAGSISAAPSAWATSSAMPMDTMILTKTYTIPK